MKNAIRNIAIVAALAAPVAAFAQVVTPANGINSDMFLAVTNNTSGASEVIDLGNLSGASLASQTWTVDPNLVSNLGGNASALTYQVFESFSLSSAAGTVLYSTFVPGSTIGLQGTVMSTQISDVNTWLTTNASFALVSGYQTATASGLASWSATTNVNGPGFNLGLAGFNAQQTVGSPIDLYAVTSTGARTAPVLSGSLGTFTLSGNVLTFSSAVTQAPLPAAAWLLVSGLLGFGGAARRRRLAVTA